MTHVLYALITTMPTHVPINPGAAANLTRIEQASIDTAFAQQKHYFLSMQSIKLVCFNALDASINDAFKVSNNPAMTGWHTGAMMG
jgi:hypothetical protein